MWAYKWIIAKIQEYDLTVYATGIDMSSAFDTIHRDELLRVAEGIMDEDGMRILRILLSNTSIEIRVKGAQTRKIETNIGGPQGDSYSGPLFTMYFENALKEMREEVGIHLESMEMPEEMIYADDYDNVTEDPDKQKRFLDKAPDILRRHNLKVNEDKTEETVLRRNKHDRKNKTTNEPWRDTVKLGSKLGDKEDMKKRRQLAMGSMNKMEGILKRHKVVNQNKRIKLYHSLVKSVLTYNSCTWGMGVQEEREMDSFHRRQLRQVLGVKYPTTMRNAVVYERAKARPLSVEITEARWKMLGHTLRMHEKTPARLAMKYYFQIPPGVKKYRGRKRTSIITTINRDIERTRKKFPEFDVKPVKTELDLRNIRVKSLNRKHWQRRVSMVTKAAYSATTSTVMN